MKKFELVMVVLTVFLGFCLVAVSVQVNDVPQRDAFTDLLLTSSWGPVVLGIILIVLGASYFHAFKEAGRIIKGRKPHAKRAVLRLVFFAALAFLIYRDIDQTWLALAAVATSTFAVCFDIFYNYHKGYRGWEIINYLGTEAWQDENFRKIPLVLLALDVALLIVSIIYFTKTI